MFSRLKPALILLCATTSAFVISPYNRRFGGVACKANDAKVSVMIDTDLDDEKVTQLFSWVSRAFAGDMEYNNLMLAIAAVFGNLGEESPPRILLKNAMKKVPPEDKAVGDSFSIEDREYASLGAMGAGQWMGQWKTRPHSLLKLNNITTVDDWVGTLPRGARRTIKRALSQNFTVTSKQILGDEPAPHSTLAAFRCVVAHEVRLLSFGTEGFLDALAEAVSRYMGTTRMTGEILEYRNEDGKVIAIAHEVTKGKTRRGQWFYADDEASQKYVWFHSVYELVRRSIDAEGVTVVDLGPSGSDAFSELKAKYGFGAYDDWPSHADYYGDFWYDDKPRPGSSWM